MCSASLVAPPMIPGVYGIWGGGSGTVTSQTKTVHYLQDHGYCSSRSIREDRVWVKDGLALWSAMLVVLRGLWSSCWRRLLPCRCGGYPVLVHVKVGPPVPTRREARRVGCSSGGEGHRVQNESTRVVRFCVVRVRRVPVLGIHNHTAR